MVAAFPDGKLLLLFVPHEVAHEHGAAEDAGAEAPVVVLPRVQDERPQVCLSRPAVHRHRVVELADQLHRALCWPCL